MHNMQILCFLFLLAFIYNNLNSIISKEKKTMEDKLRTTIHFESGSSFFPFKTTLNSNGSAVIYHKFDDYNHKDSSNSEEYFFEFHGNYKVLEHKDNWVRILINLNKLKSNHWADSVSERNVNLNLELLGNLNTLKLSEEQMKMLRYID